MPVIFHKAAAGWMPLPIATPCGVLCLVPVGYEPEQTARPVPPDSLLLVRLEPQREWAALIPEGMRAIHNGQPVPAGMRVLAHRDSLAVPGAGPVFFSTEETARIEAFPGLASMMCPRCKLEIFPEMPAVRCPGCGVVHHQTGKRPCWVYAQTCAVCPQPTALDAGLQWTPEAL